MITLPKISVITPSYNQGRWLGATMESVHRQNYENVEHIVVDGGSNDGSVDIIRSYSDKLAYWVSEPDGGHVFGLIKGFERATGDILCWLNSDDLFENSTLVEVAEFFAHHPDVEVVYGDATWIDVHGKAIRPKKEHSFSRFIWLYDHDFLPQPSTFWRRRVYERVGGLDPTYRVAIDADLFLRFSEVTRLHHVRRKWSQMRTYAEARSSRLLEEIKDDNERMRGRYLGSQPKAIVKAKWLLAKSARISWKLTTGCYWD